MVFDNSLIFDIKNVTLQLHHFSVTNIKKLFDILDNDNTISEYDKDTLVLTLFINLSNFIYKPIKYNLYYNLSNGINETPLFNTLKVEAEKQLLYLYDLFKNSLVEDKIKAYIDLLNNLYTDESSADIHINNPLLIDFIYNHFFKDMEYYILFNSNINDWRICLTSFMPMLKILKKHYSNNVCKQFILNTQIIKLKELFTPSDLNYLKIKLSDDLNIIKNFNYITFTDYNKILTKKQNTELYYFIQSYSIRKIVILTDYIITNCYKNLLQKNEITSSEYNNFLTKIDNQLEILSPKNFPLIFQYNERKLFLNFIISILKDPLVNTLNSLPYNNSIKDSYIKVTNLYNNKTSNDLFPYIFRYGIIEHYSPVLRNTVSLYFMITALLCLKLENNTRKNKSIMKILEIYIKKIKIYIIDINEFKNILNI